MSASKRGDCPLQTAATAIRSFNVGLVLVAAVLVGSVALSNSKQKLFNKINAIF